MLNWRSFLTRYQGAIGKIVASCAVVSLAIFAGKPNFESLFASFDRVHFDVCTALFAQNNSHSVVLIHKGERSLREMGRDAIFSPVDNARLFARLNGAAAIVFDIPVPAREAHDSVFFDAVRSNGKVVAALPSVTRDAKGKLLLPLLAEFANVVAAIGQRDVIEGPYGVVTGIVPYRLIDGRLYPHISLEAIRLARPSQGVGDLRPYETSQVTAFGNRPRRSILLTLSRLDPVDRYSYVDVLSGRVSPSVFAGKIVFIGHSIYQPIGEYRISSISNDLVNGAELDAMVTAALIDKGIVRKLPDWLDLLLDPLLGLVMLWICWRARPRRLHFYALLWSAAILASSTFALGWFHVWAPVGSALAICLAIYSYFVWSQLAKMHRVFRAELRALRQLATTLGFAIPSESAKPYIATRSLREIQLAMRQIRNLQEAYVNVINLLPYPVVLEQDRELLLWNQKAVELLGEITTRVEAHEETRSHLKEYIARNLDHVSPHGDELKLAGKAYMLFAIPFDRFPQIAEETPTSHLICLVDVDDVKRSVTHDRQTLRHIAHDLRNPLTTMLALIEAQSVQAGLRTGLPRNEVFMSELRNLVDYSLRMAQDFMQLSRAENLERSAFVPVELSGLVEEAVDRLIVSAKAKSISLEVIQMQSEPLLVMGNHDMLLRTVINILDNAIKYSPEDTSVEASVDHQMFSGRECAIIRVRDHGIGIPKEAIAQLFEPFFQVGTSSGTKSDGVGLGLSFVKAVADRHSGQVLVESEVGKGTIISLALPLMRVQPDSDLTDPVISAEH